jgi:hypothetical protein
MIIKRRDSKESDIKELTSLLSLPLPENKKFLIERELRFLKSGEKGEKDSAYFIDFSFGPSERWAVIHDLRLEHRDRVAQIDHLLINRFLDVYILETKNFSYGVKITEDGEFLVSYNGKYFAVPSPIEQNLRHQAVLEGIMDQYDILPKRLGLTIKPAFHSYILVSASSRVIRPPEKKFDTSMIIKADAMGTAIDKRVEKMGPVSVFSTMSKMMTRESVADIAKRLAARHKPIKIDYRKRFGIEDAPPKEVPVQKQAAPETPGETAKTKICPACGAPMVVRVSKKGAHANEPFWGCTKYPNCKAIVEYQ